MNDETTQPPIPAKEPNTPRTFLTRLLTWSETHTQVSIPVVTFIAGFVLGKVL